jgi:multidrug efflux pump subunit AcrA (membrane-fusion protein)
MSVIRSLAVLLLLVILIPLGASFLATSREVSARISEQTRLQNLERYPVMLGDVQQTVSGLGTVQADEVVNLSFQTSGLVAEVLVTDGDYVRAGDIVARLADVTQRIDYEQARLALERANNNLTDLLGPVNENEIRVAEANLESGVG